MEGNFGRDTYRSGYAAAPLISSTPVSHNHPLYRPCRIRQDDFCSSTKIAARYTIRGERLFRPSGLMFENDTSPGLAPGATLCRRSAAEYRRAFQRKLTRKVS